MTIERINRLSRLCLGFVFFYHGLVPKILWLSPTEIQIVELHNLSWSANKISAIAGIFEIALALIIVFFNKTLMPVYIAMILLWVLLVDIALVLPCLNYALRIRGPFKRHYSEKAEHTKR